MWWYISNHILLILQHFCGCQSLCCWSSLISSFQQAGTGLALSFLLLGPSCSAHTVPEGCRHSMPVQTSPAGSQSLWDRDNLGNPGRVMHTLSLVWTDGGGILCQRKVPYLVPLPHFACKSVFLLGHSEGVGFRCLFQLWRLSEMSVWKRECYMCSQGFHNNCIIPILLSFQ